MKAKQKRAILFAILGGVLLCAGAVLAFALGLPTGEAPYPDHIIDGVSPNGTTINLFDYWITTQEGADNEDPANLLTSGINYDHALLFGASLGSKGYGDWNEWTGTETPRTGIVKSGLTDGYPQLAINTSAAQNETIRNRSGSESLAYLFDPAVAVDGKASYRDAQGLLQVDKDGYYYFNSAKNYAVYYPGDNAFTLYEYPGVGSGGAAGNVGQFFPFNAATADAERYFYWPPQGADTSQQKVHTLMNTVYSNDVSLNHYFGIHMSTRFVQQYGGHVDETQMKAVTYEFSGDDDVWIFIDGVLVADLGGIHNAASVKIDFSTGIIEINGTEQGQKLGALLDVGSNTLPDDTYHTLDFFYLERGNTDSNLSLKYNLVSIPESAVIKVDENGNTLAGAEFALTVSYTENGALVTETLTPGTTGADGRLVLRESEDPGALPLTIDQLYERYGQKENLSLTLTETSTPDGYRSAGAVPLRFDKVGEQHILLAEDPWSTGAYATSGVLLTLGNSIDLYSTDGGIMGDTPVETIDLSSTTPGKMFGVIFMKDGGDWRPIHGNPIDGWTVEDDSGWQNIREALTKNPCWFQLGSGGAWEITIDELPGDINKYYNALPENELDSAQYGVFYYYTKANAVEDIDGDNTWLMNTFAESSGVQRQFFANLYVPNLRNELSVLKVDEQDQPLEGAAFALYAVDNVMLTDGGYTTAGNALLTGVTGTNGRLVFGDDELLPQGNYYLIETSAPTGYLKNGTPIPVVVDDAGVHVDAGTADNGVSVRFEAGNLVGSMWAFATDDEIDVTLHHITAKFYTTPSDAVEFDADTTFADKAWREIVGTGTAGAAFQAIDGATYHPSYYAVSDDAGGYTVYRYDENVPEGASPLGMHLKYAGNGRYAAYAGPEQQGDPVTFMETDTGWGHLMMEQCSYHTLESGKEYTELHGTRLTDLTNLFADSVTVKVANEPERVDIAVEKVWDDADDQDGKRPDAVTIRLLANGERTDRALTLNAANGWADRFSDLDVYNAGVAIVYTVEEVSVAGYQSSITGDAATGFTITNTHMPEKTAVSVQKVWNDANDQDGKRPETVTVRLLADGQDTGKTLTLNAANGWAGRFSDLAVYNAGVAIAYTVEEADVAGYQPQITGDAASGFTITNTHTPETITVAGSKTWNEADGRDDRRPDAITIRLLANGVEVAGKARTVTAADGWAWRFTDLPKYENGQEIVYTIAEDAVPGYTATVDGFNVTNTKDILSGSLTVSKTVSGNAGDTEREWAFTVWLDDTDINGAYGDMTFVGGMATFLLRHGESATATGLPAGVSYRVTETEADRDGYDTTKQGDEGVIPEGGTATATFDNAKTIAPPPTTGSLAVSKTVSGSAGDTEREWTFTVRLGDTGINGAYGDMTFVDGVATFRLRHGESVKASGLPAGVAYVVTEAEANQDGYATAATGDTGTISGGRTARAGFTNTRETPQVPPAGDGASPLLWFTLGCVCLLGLGGAAMLNRRMRGGTKS